MLHHIPGFHQKNPHELRLTPKERSVIRGHSTDSRSGARTTQEFGAQASGAAEGAGCSPGFRDEGVFTLHTKINPRCIKDLSVEYYSLELLEGNKDSMRGTPQKTQNLFIKN